MNKKQFLELIWNDIMEHTDPEDLPKKESDIVKINWDLTIGYGPTSKMLKKHLKKYWDKEAEEWLKEMSKAFDEGPLETETQKELTLPGQECH